MYSNKETLTDTMRNVAEDEAEKNNDTKPTDENQNDGHIDKMIEVSAFTPKQMDRLNILYQGMPDARKINVFRDLRTRLFKKANSKNYVCLISSIVSGGGASYIAANLAAAIAMDRSKTALLIDGNLYSPSVERLMAVDPIYGLTDYLYRENTQIEEIVYASGIPRLRVIPVGNNRESGAEYFSSGRMRQFVESVKNRYQDRFIIIDAPCVYDYMAETHILADLCDFTVMVVPYGRVVESQLTAGIEAIGQDQLAGIVYNR